MDPASLIVIRCPYEYDTSEKPLRHILHSICDTFLHHVCGSTNMWPILLKIYLMVCLNLRGKNYVESSPC